MIKLSDSNEISVLLTTRPREPLLEILYPFYIHVLVQNIKSILIHVLVQSIKSILNCNILCNSIIYNSIETGSSRYYYPYCPNNICQKLCFQNHLFLKHPYPLGPEEIDGLLVPPDKAYSLLTGRLDYSLTTAV